jgi:hypothetical protein
MAQTDIETIEGLPLKEASTQKQQPVVDLVDQILDKKKKRIISTKDLEKEIDRLIYNLCVLS